MALELYDLVSLRTRCAEEFGLDLTDSNVVDQVDKRINDAVAWIVNRRKNWPWLDAETTIDIGEGSSSVSGARYGAALFTKMSRAAQYLTSLLTPVSSRELLVFDDKGYDGIMVTDVAGATVTLEHAHTGSSRVVSISSIVAGSPTTITVSLTDSEGGTIALPANVATFYIEITGNVASAGSAINGTHEATRVDNDTFTIAVNSTGSVWSSNGTAQIAKEFRVGQAYFLLPDDYIRADAVHLDDENDWNTVYYRHPTVWKREIRNDKVYGGINRIYTVLPDPLKADYSKYIAVYPYFIDRNVLFVKYWRDARKMVGDYDEPDVPRSDRLVVLYASYWFVAQMQQSDLVSFYRDGALNELERMAKEYQLSDDLTEDVEHESGDIGPVQGPYGFPKFDI